VGAKDYIHSRTTCGINALWISLICPMPGQNAVNDGPHAVATAGDPSTSDPAYFDLADKAITLAE
jgi:hypothetical protein